MEDMDFEGYTLNYEKIVQSKDMAAVTRLLAADLMKNPYLVVGDFIKNIADSDLQFLLSLIEHKNESRYGELLCISEMLATGEGCPPSGNLDEYTSRMNLLTTFIICESLCRKGLVKVYNENMSFHDDMKDATIVEKL